MRTVPFLLALAALAAAPTLRAEAPEPLSDQELAARRGGVRTPFGYELGFGARVRTYVDGSLALETRLTWTEDGPLVQGGAEASGGGTWTAYLPAALGGGTQVRHELNADRIASVVVNTASGRTVRQETDIVLALPQLADLEAQARASRTAEGLHQALGIALSDAAR